MGLIIRKPGILTTVQDLGRVGSRRFGINPNGAMDTAAVRAINIAVGNAEDAPVLEMHFPAAEIEFDCDTLFGIAGSDLGAVLDGKNIENWSMANAAKGSMLRFTRKSYGNRAYFAVKGGIETEPWLGSASTNLVAAVGGYRGRALKAGDVLRSEVSRGENIFAIGRSLIPRYSRYPTLRVLPGGEFDLLTALSEKNFLSMEFKLTTDSNRMGFRLRGEPLYLLENRQLVSAATSFGTIQLLPDGQLIVLMADHQTAGGYPRIANIISADLPLAGQLGSGDQIMFKMVSLVDAEIALAKFERDFRFLRMGCLLRSNVSN